MSEAEIAEAVKLSADAQEDAKIETAAMLRGEMNEKAKHDLLEMAMHNNDIVTHHQEAPYTEADENVYNDNDEAGGDADGGAPLDADNGDQDEGEDVDGEDEEGDEADEAEEMDIAARNAKLMEMAVHNNEIVQHDLEEEQEVVDARMKLLVRALLASPCPALRLMAEAPEANESTRDLCPFHSSAPCELFLSESPCMVGVSSHVPDSARPMWTIPTLTPHRDANPKRAAHSAAPLRSAERSVRQRRPAVGV